MSAFWGWITGLFETIGSWVVPVLGSARSPQGVKLLRWTIHFLLVIAGLAALAYLQYREKVGVALPGVPDIIRRRWLPLAGLLLYIFFWCGWWLWKLLTTKEAAPFPDIVEAWNEAASAVEKAGIPIGSTPIFLILGRPDDKADNLFEASGLTFKVRNAPGGKAPIGVWANHDAIFITCSGASLMGKLNDFFTSGSGGRDDGQAPVADEDTFGKTIAPGMDGGADDVDPIMNIMNEAQRQGRGLGSLNPVEQRRIRSLERADRRGSILKDANLIEECLARLHCLMTLLTQDRHPVPAINGLLVLIPYFALENEQYAAETADVIRRDREVVQRATRLSTPIVSLLADMETASGFRAFLEQFAEKDRKSRLGQGHPLRPNLERLGEAAEAKSGNSRWLLGQWICTDIATNWAFKKFQLEDGKGLAPDQATHNNAQLFLFCQEMRVRAKRLSGILSKGFEEIDGEPALFGGCYFAATGGDPKQDRGFVGDVFKRVLHDQAYVSWTEAAFAEDASVQSRVRLGYIALGIVCAIILAAVGSQVANKMK